MIQKIKNTSGQQCVHFNEKVLLEVVAYLYAENKLN